MTISPRAEPLYAIAVSDTGSLSKLFAEAIENVDRKPIEGLKASGANLFQVMRLAIVPQERLDTSWFSVPHSFASLV